MAYIEIYTKKNCPYCDRAKSLLIKKSLDFKEITIDDNNLLNNMYIEMKQRSNGCTTVPQIFIDGLHIGGSDDLVSLNNQGKLK
ncbi:glutaredoxin 3 [Blochmannia endosymbiont of Camponotus sp.]|uniref:glutaredoxin 3 n=1 Tax=Blochmannia endosymbiont of Camponotus sp. TaxID=700220 RepID=UPI002024B6AE|nr:glutaredoxin 3 [Blochmannia endosymbiont of Camponotus sp.]URJ29815.1 glutaredoxin 3 [Blochmannia endosymbiont of Camponotus sp.]URJ31286.1 glutaredoxin 3 [Blochmannia endosymbiont of Camponotus sp.]